MRAYMLAGSLAAAVVLGGCEGNRTDTMRRLAEVEAISAQKDSLLREVTSTAAFIADLGREINKVRGLRPVRATQGVAELEDDLTPAARRADVLDRVRRITERLMVAENRLAESRKRVAALTGDNAERSARLAAFDSTLGSFKEIMAHQKDEIASLTAQVNSLTAENASLKASNVALAAEKSVVASERDALQSDRNTVYYVVGKKRDLLDRRLIEVRGGFLGLGTTPVPARALDTAAFSPLDMRRVNEIPLPDPKKSYQIITRQNLAALEDAPDKSNRVSGALRIRDSGQFWANSKFLILVEQ